MQKKSKRSLPGRILDFFLKSLIISSLCAFTTAIYKKIARSITGAVFASYEWISEKLMESTIIKRILPARYARDIDSPIVRISKLYDSSLFSITVHKIKWAFLTCQLNVLAIFGLTFGLSSALMLILENFAFSIKQVSLSGIVNIINPLVTSLAFIAVSILFIFSKKPLVRAINESLFFGFIFFDFFAMRKVPASDYSQHTGLNAGIAALLGISLGALSIWIPPSTVATAIGIFIAFLIILHSPEAGTVSTILLLPFSSTMALVFLVLSTALSFFIKCLRRKRILKFEGLDLLVMLFSVFIFSGGVVSVDIISSVPKMLVYLSFLSIYFIIKNVIKTETLALSCMRSLAVSSMIVSFIGIVQYLFGDVSQIWQDLNMFSSIRGRTVSTFENPNVLGEYLVLVLPLLFAMLLCVKKFNLKMLFFVSFSLGISCLVLTWSRGAWLGFLFSMLVFVLLKSPAFLAGIILLFPSFMLIPAFFMETDFLKRLVSIGSTADSSTAYRIDIWEGSLRLITDKGLYGIGIGTEAFSSVFPQYALSGTEGAPHTHSLYLQLIAETGIFSLLVFLIICLAYFSLVCAYIKKSPGNDSRTVCIGLLCGIFAFLVQGLTDYAWYNYRVYLFFWVMLGLAMAVLNLCKENDIRKYSYS
jgi:O-antigen ligase